jgi:hypothetical protein
MEIYAGDLCRRFDKENLEPWLRACFHPQRNQSDDVNNRIMG